MKKMKLLSPILTGGALLSLTVGTLASCSKSTPESYANIEGAETSVSIVGNDIYAYLTFTLHDKLGDKTLKTNLEATKNFKFGDPVVTNKLVQVPVVWCGDMIEQDYTETWNVTFTCYDGSTKVWQETINKCSATYKPTIVLDTTKSSKEEITEVIDEAKKVFTGTYYFKLTEELEDEGLTLKPWLTDLTDGYKLDAAKTKMEIDPDDKTQVVLTVVAEKQDSSEIAIGDKMEFTLQIECLYNKEYTYWQSVKMPYFSLSYNVHEVDIDTDTFKLEEITPGTPSAGYKLTSIDWQAVNEDANTLFIPAKATSDKWIRQIGGDGLTPDPLKLKEHNISKIKFEGIGVQTVAAQAFYGVDTLKYIDLSGIDDDVKSLKNLLTFGTYSFAGLPEKGTIIWHADLSKYKQSIFKYKFYQAGLTSPAWFGFTKVSTEEQLREAARVGANIQLQNDITISVADDFTGEVEFYSNSIVDLNGYTITSSLPIYNTEKAEYALIGIWDCEVVFTDSSDGSVDPNRCHNGCVKACDNSDIVNQTSYPAVGKSNRYWEWGGYKTDAQGAKHAYWKPRESRCFYVRSDIPSKAQGTLEISAGKYYGNCTTAFNYNTIIYIDDMYSEQTSVGSYQGEYAPEFHLYSPYFSAPLDEIPESGLTYSNPTQEMLNCWEDTYASGVAKFQCWGGKYFGKKVKPGDTYTYFNPAKSQCDTRTLGPANWTEIEVDGTKIKIADHVTGVIGTGDNSYIMVVPLIAE